MQESLSDRDQIARVIGLYFTGMYHSRGEDIEACFHPNATISGYRGDELVEMSRDNFRDFVTSQPPPAESGEPFDMKIDSVETKGRVAMVKVTDRYLNRMFTDLLLLMKTEEGWRIYNKVWHADPL